MCFLPDLGFFDPYYLNHSKIALLKSNNGTVVAFATVEKSHSENSLSVDFMPYLNEAPKGVMDVLFIHLIHYAKDETISTFNMGMCPLSNVGKTRFSFFNEKLGHLLYQFGSHIYSFDGLRHYKEKFGTLLYCLPQTMPFSMCDHGLIIGLLSVRIRSRPEKRQAFVSKSFYFNKFLENFEKSLENLMFFVIIESTYFVLDTVLKMTIQIKDEFLRKV